LTVRIRAHHLLCMLAYVGKGYSSAFVEGYDRVVERLGDGEDLLLVAGPDDICKPLLEDAQPHCLCDSVTERDKRAAAAVEALLGRPVREGVRMVLEPDMLRRMREAFRTGRLRGACQGCEWFDLCTGIAGDGFRGVRLSNGGRKQCA
jgi:hypothetical protein